jgi:hypothetical protein
VIDLDGNSIVAGGGAYTIWSPHGTYIATPAAASIRNLHTGTVRRRRNASARNRLVAGRKVDRWRPAQVSRSVHARDGSHSQGSRRRRSTAAPELSHGLVAYTHTGECGIDIARQDGRNARRLTRAADTSRPARRRRPDEPAG